MIYNDILEAVGNTPLIRLRNMVKPGMAQILVKFEGLNVGGSIKTRTALNMINEAERILNEAPISERDAEWNFLMGMCAYRRGFNEQANTYFNTACNMDPNNAEYRTAVNNMNNQRAYNYGGYTTNPNVNSTACSVCDICSAIMCADCLCSCCRSC